MIVRFFSKSSQPGAGLCSPAAFVTRDHGRHVRARSNCCANARAAISATTEQVPSEAGNDGSNFFKVLTAWRRAVLAAAFATRDHRRSGRARSDCCANARAAISATIE